MAATTSASGRSTGASPSRATELPEDEAVEHQFLWPLGRVKSYPDETHGAAVPAVELPHRAERGRATRDVDWYLLFPFLWGGYSADDRENYFALFPLYADIPQFLTYDRWTHGAVPALGREWTRAGTTTTPCCGR